MHLRLEEAAQLIRKIKREDSENLIVYHLENYIDFFRVFIGENKKEFKELEKNKKFRLEQLSRGDQSSPYYLYTQAEVKLQWALARLKFEEYFAAFNEVRSAYKLLNKNLKKFPEFKASKKSLGILHALIGTVPDQYKWGIKLLGGMSGTIDQGRREIEEVLDYARDHDFIFEEETLVMYAFLMMNLKNQKETAWDLISRSELDPNGNPLACFVLANVAMNTGRNDEAIQLLENRPKGPAYLPFPFLDYMLGLTKLYRLDKDAGIYFQKYLVSFRGRNYIKEAYQKMAWLSLISEDQNAYHRFIENCLVKGAAVIGGDKNAEKEARTKAMPHPQLLKARLLFDGGYYQRAYRLLQSNDEKDFRLKRFRLEYNYRLGRVSHAMKKYNEAKSFYHQTIEKGKEEGYYYACNSALQMGLLFETQEDFRKAEIYFQQALAMRPDEYRSSLHQKAKAGLNRLKDSQ